MSAWLGTAAWGLVLMALGTALAWWCGWRPTAFTLVMLPLPAAMVALLVVHGVPWLYRSIRMSALKPYEGRYYAYQDHGVDVWEDALATRWVRVSDVRHIIAGFPSDGVLSRLYPLADVRVCHPDAGPDLRIRAEVLLAYLATATRPESLQFKKWLERDVVMPARKKAEMLQTSGSADGADA